MTAWQDQPPQSGKPLSRRQVRQNERGDATNAVVDLPAEPAERPDFSSFAREGWDTEARRIAAATPLTPQQPLPPQQPAGRRSQRSLQAVDPNEATAEPLEYLTQARPQVQSPDGQQFRRRSAPAVPPTGEQSGLAQLGLIPGEPVQPAVVPPAAAPLPFEQQQSYRLRDFSPEGRPSFSSTMPETVDPAVPENLQYRTHGTPPPFIPAAPAPVAPVQQVESPVEERTFSRRELRAMEAAKNTLSEAAPVAPSLEQPLVRDRTRSAAAEPVQPIIERFGVPSQYDPQQFPTPQQAAPPVSPQAAPPVAQEPAFIEPSTWTPPTGHWSTQAMIDDDEQVQENTLSRNVGVTSGAITTSALVLPSLPADSLTRPLGSTGEILITGTIDLPLSLGSTGAHPGRYDHSDVDAFLEAGDREDSESNPDSAPVRAIKAVSTHTSTRGVMEAKKPKGSSRLPLILGVAATVMAVGVVVLVVCAMVFGVFNH